MLHAAFISFLSSMAVIPALFLLLGRSQTLRRAISIAMLLLLGVGTAAAAVGFWGGAGFGADLSAVSPLPFALTVDRLSAFFLFLICAVSIPVVLFSTSYVERHYEGMRRQVLWASLPLFIGSMAVVVTASTAFAFLVGWELMTLFSAGLILIDGDEGDRRHSVFIYLVMMHAGAAAVAASFFLFIAHAPGLDFAAMRSAAPGMGAGLRTAIFLLSFVGFGTKAGIIPLHLWLPRAHPIAPSPVSALMSGVMLKTAIYGMVRFTFDFLGTGPAWWGYLLLAAGALSGVLGVLYALGEHDLKRLLAYSSVENIGLMYLGLGASWVLLTNGAPGWASVALVAALLHCLNHAIFKSALFLGAGAIYDSAHTIDLEELGGLLNRMKFTGAALLVACGAIAGLPLLNGFVGEWLMFRSFIAGSALTNATVAILLPLLVGVLALVGGLAASCFVNVYGVAFLGRPRSTIAGQAMEVPAAMRAALALLAASCVVLGVFPGLILRPLSLAVHGLVPTAVTPDTAFSIVHIVPWLALALAVLVALVVTLRRSPRVTNTWACGLPGLDTRMQYTSSALSKPLRKVFARAYRAERTVEVSPAGATYFPESISYRSQRTTSFERALYRPAVDAIVSAGNSLRRLQTGNIQVYLLYIFVALVALLIFARFA